MKRGDMKGYGRPRDDESPVVELEEITLVTGSSDNIRRVAKFLEWVANGTLRRHGAPEDASRQKVMSTVPRSGKR